ncbi:MAG TPA: NirA family protein [Opitutaceae bacterium]|jgi:ferredoxin-nitrite reductase|nr:NirA family protein [Opitutaceae bacterium]
MPPGSAIGRESGFSAEQIAWLEAAFSPLAHRPFVGVAPDGRLTSDPAAAPANLAEPGVFGTPRSDLSKPERWKLDENPLDIWDKLVAHAESDRFPDEADAFRFKYHGLFYVAPAQDSFMLRLRIPAGEISSDQLHGLTDLAEDLGDGCLHVTTRANLQVREFRPKSIVQVLTSLQELGLTSRGAGADNVRNITATPTSGFDPAEFIDVRPFAKGLHHYILNQRDLYGLPRKFNVAFESGGAIEAAADTNDIGFVACRIAAAGARDAPPPGVYFRVQVGGITGHKDFARDTGLLIRPDEAVAVAAAMIRVFSEHGDRTDRKKARLKYLLERWGLERFVAEAERRLASPLRRWPLAQCERPRAAAKHGWIGITRQSQPGLNAIGVRLPAGRLSGRQAHGLADAAGRFGKGEVRLTVWQNLLLPHVADAHLDEALRAVHKLGLATEARNDTGGIIACTGRMGCKYAAADTKAHAAALGKALLKTPEPDHPVNIHFTGCPHSCAQHYCGDIGLVGAKLADGAEGYHVVVGGGLGAEQGIAREIFRGVRADEVNELIVRILERYRRRHAVGETFAQWSRRHSVGELQTIFSD